MQNTHTYIYIYICCEVIIWAKFGVLKGYYLGQARVVIWAEFVFALKNRCFGPSFFCSVIILCFFPVICQFSKNSLFQKKGAKLGFSKFLCFKLNIWKLSFLGLLKHYKIGVSADVCVFCCWKRRKRQKKMITGIYEFGLFCPKMAVSWRITVFWNWCAETPIFIVFWGCALSGPSCQKGEFLYTHQKIRNFWLITEKLIFWFFFVFVCFV